MLAITSHADLDFYEASAQVIPVLLLAAAVGESRVKIRKRVNGHAAIILVFAVALAICAGEVAALRVLTSGDDSKLLFDLTAMSLGLGLGFLIQYLSRAAYNDVVGPDVKPSATEDWMLTIGGLLVAVGTVLFLAL
jgi:hypothetical protein